MKRTKFWLGGVVAALVVTGIAVAAGGANTVTPSATFNAAAKRVQTQNCTGSDGAYTVTHGRYEGTMTSTNAALNGKVRIDVHSVYNNDESAGWMQGDIRVLGDDSRVQAKFQAVNLDGNVEGLVTGRAGKPKAGLLANFSATFGGGGFTDGKLGTGASANEALLYNRGCVRDEKKPKDDAATHDAKPKGDAKPKDDTQQQAPERKERTRDK
jgi:hypothetical protein